MAVPSVSQKEKDRGAKAGDLLPFIFEGEQVINIEYPDIKVTKAMLSPEEALLRLLDAKDAAEIGKTGILRASIATEENASLGSLRLFEAAFGRDSLISAFFLLERFPLLARSVILMLAKYQGTRTSQWSEEEPGRIMHEYRDPEDPIGKLIKERNGWEFPYYGSVDATPLFVILVVKYRERYGEEILSEKYADRSGEERTVLDAVERSVDWILLRAGANEQGFIEYKREHPGGILNQVWKDSWDSYFHKDGEIANHASGIASVEVQGYAFDALSLAHDLFTSRPDRYGKDKLDLIARTAAKLRAHVLETLWTEDDRGGYFALGTDRDPDGRLRKLEIRASNMGHLLNSSLLLGDDPEITRMCEALVRTLMSPEFFSASGIRTLSSKEKRFRPGAYHNGSVWPWDNYWIACGMKRHGFKSEARMIEEKILAVCRDSKKYPEFARGVDGDRPEINSRIVDIWSDTDGKENRIEQPPQEIQAWTVASVLAIESQKA